MLARSVRYLSSSSLSHRISPSFRSLSTSRPPAMPRTAETASFKVTIPHPTVCCPFLLT